MKVVSRLPALKYKAAFTLAVLSLYSCTVAPPPPPGLPPIVPTTPETSETNFHIYDPESVAYHQFNVTSAGDIEITADWTGASSNLTMELQGRRRPSEPDPTQPYAIVTGVSPLTLSYSVTQQDLARGVAWRVVLRDEGSDHDAKGSLETTVPVNASRQEAFDRNRIGLRGGDLQPSQYLQLAFLNQLSDEPRGYLHGVATLTKACNCRENRELQRLGVTFLSYLPRRHTLARIERGANPAASPLIAAFTPIEPEDKIHPDILVGNYARFNVAADDGTTNTVLAPDGQLKLTISFYEGVENDDITDALALASNITPLSDTQYEVRASVADMRTIAENDSVAAIDPAPAPILSENNNSRAVINANGLQGATVNTGDNTIAYTGATGQGVTIGIQDSGVDGTHPDLNVVAAINPAPQGSHGTHVAGIAAGSGLQSALVDAAGNNNNGAEFQWRGMAPRAGLISAGNLDTTGDMLNAIQNQSLDVTNRSQSISFDGNYDAEHVRIDQMINGSATAGGDPVPRRLLVVSAGNHGNVPWNQRPTTSPPAGTNVTAPGQTGYFSITKQMKNAVVVGNRNAGPAAAVITMAGGSSLGPAYDGRIKPDIVGLGTGVMSTGTVGDGSCVPAGTDLSNGYTACNGTSMASPAIAGGVAQLLEVWHNTYNQPIGATLDANPPTPALLRALLIQTATDIVTANVRGVTSDLDADSTPGNGNDGTGLAPATVGPDYTTGWGTANINAAAALIQDQRTEAGRPFANRMIQSSIFQGGIRDYDFVVDAPGEIRVTLAWDDEAAAALNPATSPMLVNDLDLELIAPDGTVFYPWQLGQTILDGAGNPIADDAQPPGTSVQVVLPVTPITNPTYNWQSCAAGTAGCVAGWRAMAPNAVDYIPNDLVDGNGINDLYIAGTGKDRLNNVEQVVVNVTAGQTGRWRARVIGFDVRTDTQDFALVGFPYPDLAELVPSSSDRVALPGFGESISFDWQVENTGGQGTGVGFEYQILLSRDFSVDADDIVLTDTHSSAGPFAPLASGDTVSRTSTVTITQSDAAALLGNPSATIDDLIDSDVFLLVYVDSGDVVLEHDETNLLAIQIGRLVDVVMVMDRSGSMGASVPISGGFRAKIDILKDSANLFVDLLRQDAGDRLGMVSFANSESVDFDDGSGTVRPFGAGEVTAAAGAIDGMSAGGATNIRAALQAALDLIPTTDDRRRVVLFFSDGMRTAGGDPTETSFLQQFDSDDIKVFSVGFGTEGGSGLAGIDTGLLQTLSNVGDQGFYFVTESALELDKFFVNALANAISAEVIIDPVASIPPGGAMETPISVNGQDRRVTFVQSWESPLNSLSLDLVTPSGYVIRPSNYSQFADALQVISTPTYRLIEVTLPLTIGANEIHGGTWTMRARSTSDQAFDSAATAIAESTIGAQTVVNPPTGEAFVPSDPMTFTTRTSANGAALTGADVFVTVKAPLISIGNALASAYLTEAEIAQIPAVVNGDEVSMRERMVSALTARSGGVSPITYETLSPMLLTEADQPGVYTGKFGATRVPGVYTFTTRIESLTDECEPFTRESSQSAVIPERVDRDSTPVIVTRDPRGGSVVATVTPRDRAGNYVGPGFERSVTITANGLTPTGEVIDNRDGSYQRTFMPDGQAPRATIDVTVQGISLPTYDLALTLPAPGGITVPSGSNSGTTATSVTIGAASVSEPAVSGVILVDRYGSETIIREVTQDNRSGQIHFTVPAKLMTGNYDIVLLDRQGRKSLTSKEARFRVLNEVGAAETDQMEDALKTLTATGDKTGIVRTTLLRLIRESSIDPNGKREAAKELMALLATDAKGPYAPSDLKATEAAISSARSVNL